MSDNQNHEELIRQFIDVTGIDSETARTLLEESAWELDLAIYRFFEDGSTASNVDRASRPAVPVVEDSDSDDEVNIITGRSPAADKKEDKKKKKKNPSKFATLQSLQSDSSSDEEEGQAFYAGGSERSGQQIIGPGKKDSNQIVENMFKTLRQQGAEVVEPSAAGSSSGKTFGGTGYRLGATPDDTVVFQSNQAKKRDEEEIKNIVLKLWKTGFSLDDGELRPYNDPENAQFLESVTRGEIPRELRHGPEVHVTMEDHRFEEFKRVVSKKPFQGKGHMLGSPAPTTIGSTSPQATSPSDQEANLTAAQAALNVNENEPATNIQFRLADGSRLTGRFNHSHTVGNMRDYIVSAAPSYQLQTFVLQTTFPNKVLEDNSKTIAEEGLQNAVVVQRLK